MKRSEMIEKLLRFTDGNKEKADLILKDIELFGMLPPERKLGMKDAEALRGWSGYDQVRGYHSWDKEND